MATRAHALATDEDMRPAMRQSISARLLAGAAFEQNRASHVRGLYERFWSRPVWLGAIGVAVVAIAWATWGGMRKDAHVEHVDHVDHVTSPATRAAVATQGPHDKSPSGFQSRASVRAVEAARFTRIAAPPDERILLQDGVIVLDVVRLGPNERFRVVTDDAEVEVRGTHFQVSASRGRLMAVRVTSGRVEVRSTRGAQATLDAGDEWVGASENPPPPTPPKSPETSMATATRESTVVAESPPNHDANVASETIGHGAGKIGSNTGNKHGSQVARSISQSFTESFDRGGSLLRSGNTRAAATAFAEVERSAAGQPLEEDASYWRAVAVARSGDTVGAQNLFGAFLRRFPASARRGEASVALGWLLLEAGQSAEARIQFERASSDPSGPVRNSASEGLRRTKSR